MKNYLTPNDLAKISNVKGTIIKQTSDIVLVKQKADAIEPGMTVFTVWNPLEGYTFISTPNEDEALKTFDKYTNP